MLVYFISAKNWKLMINTRVQLCYDTPISHLSIFYGENLENYLLLMTELIHFVYASKPYSIVYCDVDQ